MKIGDENHQPIRVLVVEDSPTEVLMARADLEGKDSAFEVASFDRVGAALAHAARVAVDVLLLDLGLPDAQGLDTFIRAHAALPDVPIVIFSSLHDEELALQAVQLGAQDYLLKTNVMRDLLPRALRYAVERHRAQRKLADFAREMQEKNAVLEEEFRLARQVHLGFLPREYPQFSDLSGWRGRVLQFAHRYCPAATLSGDFFHILPLSEGQAGVFICDVMGRGVRAALIGALARGFILQATPRATEPGEFLTSLNHELAAALKHTGTEAFASAFYLVADLAKRQVRYANAGHPGALILRRDAAAVDWLRVESPYQPPLGLLAGTVYRDAQTVLAERDGVVLFTDGLYQQDNAAGEQFGHGRLLDAVSRRLGQPCETLLDDLVNETRQFAGHEEFDDDVCLVGLDVVSGPPFEEKDRATSRTVPLSAS